MSAIAATIEIFPHYSSIRYKYLILNTENLEYPELGDDEEWEMDDEDHSQIQVDDEMEEETSFNSRPRVYIFAPTKEDAFTAFTDITNILKPPRKTGRGYKKDTGLDNITRTRLEGMRMFLGAYIRLETDNPGHQGNWTEASKKTVNMWCESKTHAINLRVWSQSFIDDRNEITGNNYGSGNKSAIDDEDFAQEIHLHLQQIGIYIYI